MKKFIPLFIVAVSLTLSACKKDNKESKIKELAELKQQASEIKGKIATLERELGASLPSENVKVKYVSVDTVSAQPFNHFIELNGRIESDKNIMLSSRSAGAITKVNVTRGQKVQKGQVLATIDPAVVSRGLDELKSALDLATIVYDKQKNLWEQKIGTEIQYLQAKNNKESLEKKLASLQEQYEMTLIKATISGVVDEVFVREGEITSPGVPAFRIVGSGDYKVTAEIPETYLSKVSTGDAVEVFLPDLNETIKTKIFNVSNVISNTSRTFAIQATIPDKYKNIKANMIAEVRIRDYSNNKAVVIPINVIQRGEDGEYVFIAEGNVAKKKNIKAGQNYRSNAEVLTGLNSGDKIITAGFQDLVEGQNIKF